MIVYGDPSFKESASLLFDGLRQRLTQLQNTSHPNLDELRTLLIHAGQMEQACADFAPELLFQPLTDAIARAFFCCWNQHLNRVLDCSWTTHEELTAALRALDTIAVPAQTLSVKLPEGFAFYTLFPEQYLVATRKWCEANCDATAQQVVVAGVRSIGTTLSSLVLAVLHAAHWKAHRVTVRPSGHPFERQVQLSTHQVAGASLAVVVDEGPGLSGSSMAATAQALHEAGVPKSNISFLPGHGENPGSYASTEVRDWWQNAPRYVVPLGELRWQGRSLLEHLSYETEKFCQETVVNIEDAGGGAWRHAAYSCASAWPAVCAPFERTKYLCTLKNGWRVLWKFEGLAPGATGRAACEEVFATHQERATAGWTTPSLCHILRLCGNAVD
jgi:hypothetical protein